MALDPLALVDANTFIAVSTGGVNATGTVQGGVNALTAAFGNGSNLILTDAVNAEVGDNISYDDAQAFNQWVAQNNIKDVTTQTYLNRPPGTMPADLGEESLVEIAQQRLGLGYQPNIVSDDSTYFTANASNPTISQSKVQFTPQYLTAQQVMGNISPEAYATLRDQIDATGRNVGQSSGAVFQNDPALGVEPELPLSGPGPVTYRLTSAPEDPGTVAVDMTPTATAPIGEAPATAVTQDANQLVLDLGAGAGEGAISGGLTAAALEGLGKTLGVLGIAAVVVDLASSAEAAETDIQQGNNAAAATTMEQWAARTALGLAEVNKSIIHARSPSAHSIMHLSEMPLAA